MEQYCNDLLLTALKVGIPEEEFWQMTIGEVSRRVDAYSWNHETSLKERATMDYQQAQTLALFVNKIFSGGDVPEIEDIYPSLFEKEQRQLGRSVANFKAFAAQFNARFNK